VEARETNAQATDATMPTQQTGGATAVLDPPMTTDDQATDDAVSEVETHQQMSQPMVMRTVEGWMPLRGQTISYLEDDDGHIRGADITMQRKTPSGEVANKYEARIRWEDGQLTWSEPDTSEPSGWKTVQRGQHNTQLQPIVEQAIEYAAGRVFGVWP
jgi:hypothetical protein